MKTEFFPFKDGSRKKDPGMSDKSLPSWIKVDKKRFDKIKYQIQNVKNNNLQARPNRGSPISFDESHKLMQDIEHGKTNHEEALKTIANICNDIETIDDLDEFNQKQVSVLNALFLLDEIFTGEFKWYKLIDGKYKLLRSKSNQKELDVVEKKPDIEKFKQQIEDQEKK